MSLLSKAERFARLKFVPQKAVQWLAPRELAAAGLRVGLSAAFGEYSDKRELEALFDESLHTDLPHGSTELWLDYVADLGDGFDATFTVAKAVAEEKLDVDGSVPLPRGSVLILGGDEVYPTAGRIEYQNRTTGPYQTALERTKVPHPRMFAIPGNHDWYDGLTSFIREFCDQKWMGGWRLPQTRSYFAVRVAPHWWLWGIDIQFEGYIDTPQIDFFSKVGDQLQPGDGIIMCSAKPAWAHAGKGVERPSAAMNNLDFVVRKCVPNNVAVRLNLAGDWHHYARYAEADTGAQYVTSGGGGAYLSATHHLESNIAVRGEEPDDDRHLELVTTYPDVEYSRSRRFTAPFTGARNPTFGVLIGAIYLLVAALAIATKSGEATFVEQIKAWSNTGLFETWGPALRAVFGGIFGIGVVIALSGGFIGVANPKKVGRPRAIAAGLLHVGAHLVTIAAGIALTTFLVSGFGADAADAWWWGTWVGLMALFGVLVGPVVFGMYLGVADIANINTNELFAGQRIEHRKHFLRMHITDEKITVYVIGIDRIPRWKPDFDSDPKQVEFKPHTRHPEQCAPRLIEKFTVIREPES